MVLNIVKEILFTEMKLKSIPLTEVNIFIFDSLAAIKSLDSVFLN